MYALGEQDFTKWNLEGVSFSNFLGWMGRDGNIPSLEIDDSFITLRFRLCPKKNLCLNSQLLKYKYWIFYLLIMQVCDSKF